MAFRQYSLTLTGVAQRLSDVYGDGVGVAAPASDIPYLQVLLAADPANANVVYVGADSTLSTTKHAFSLDPTEASQGPVSLGPFATGGAIKLADLWVLGTNAQRVMVGGVPF